MTAIRNSRPGRPAEATAETASALGLAILAVAIVAWRFVGYQGHDDAYYAVAALDWAHNFPALGNQHWALRYPLVVPVGAVIHAFGFSIAALASMNLAAYAAFLLAGYAAARHWFGWPAAVALTLIGILLPQFPVQATYANPDMLEMALVMASFWLVMLARDRGGPVPIMLAAGALAGVAFLARETTLLLAPLYGLMMLVRPGMARWRYLLIAVGFLAVASAQMGYFAYRTGDPLYRIRLSATHDRVDRTAQGARATGALDSEGVLATGTVTKPLAALFVSQKFGLLFYLAIPAYVILRRRRNLSPQARSVLDWSAVGAVVSFLFVALNVGILYIVPRYFMVTAAFAAVPVAVLAAQAAMAWPKTTGLLAAGFAASCLGLLYLENTQPMFAEAQAAEFAATERRPIYAAPESTWRMGALFEARGVRNLLSEAPPPPNAFVADVDGVVEACLRTPSCPWQPASTAAFKRVPGWTEVTRRDAPRRILGTVLRQVGLAQLIPPDIFRKIEQPSTGLVIYRTPPA